MNHWKRFIDWCKRPDMIKIRRFNLDIGEKGIRINPTQVGVSIFMGWIIFLVCYFVIQPLIRPHGDESFWIMLLSGLSLISWGMVKKGKSISTRIGSIDGKTLLQIGAVVTIIWFIITVQREGPFDLGLPKLYITVGHMPDGDPIRALISVILLVAGFPVLGLILVVSGIIFKFRARS